MSIANDIERLVQEGIPKNEIAIITKKNSTLENLSKLLLEKHIPVALSKEENVFDDDIVALLVNMLVYIESIVR